MVSNFSHTIEAQPDRWRVQRFAALTVAVGCTLITVLASRHRLIGTLGPLRFHIGNPLKVIALAVVALQMWCLLTPGLHALAGRLSRYSLLQWWLLISAVELAIVAALGVAIIDFQWGWGAPFLIAKPRVTATLAFCFATAFLLSLDNCWTRVCAAVPRFQMLWEQWDWRARIVFVVVLVHGVGVTKVLLGYWEQTSSLFLTHQAGHAPQFGMVHKWNSTFDHFCDDCRQVIPKNARVLYRGPTEGLVLAYELYPRRVFMLPSEQRALFHNGWQTDLWCRGMAPDPLEDCWKWDPPLPELTAEQFIAQHGITHIVVYDNKEEANCTIQALR